MTPSEPPVEPALDQQLRDRPDQSTPVVVVFTEPRSPEELQDLDLYAGGPGASSIAYGELNEPAIRALEARNDIAKISGIPVLPARPPEDAHLQPPLSRKIAPDLALQLDRHPGASQHVIVTFGDPPGSDAMDDLGLLEAGPTIGAGKLNPTAIHQLAERGDVLLISWSAPPELLSPR
jgi:hypothetical protein